MGYTYPVTKPPPSPAANACSQNSHEEESTKQRKGSKTKERKFKFVAGRPAKRRRAAGRSWESRFDSRVGSDMASMANDNGQRAPERTISTPPSDTYVRESVGKKFPRNNQSRFMRASTEAKANWCNRRIIPECE
jgi:hypothetical protein